MAQVTRHHELLDSTAVSILSSGHTTMLIKNDLLFYQDNDTGVKDNRAVV